MDALPRRLRATFPPVRHLIIDVFKFVLLAAVLKTVMIRIKDGLNYRWEWSALPWYLFRFDGEQEREFERLGKQGPTGKGLRNGCGAG